MQISIERYNPGMEQEWDEFVRKDSVNGTIYHTRKFLSYHPRGRFEDTSILVRDGTKLVAVVPSCKTRKGFVSHLGSPYGGPVIREGYHHAVALESLVEAVHSFYNGNIVMRLAERPLWKEYSDALVFFLGRSYRLEEQLGVFKKLPPGGQDLLSTVRKHSARNEIRQAQCKGARVEQGSSDEHYQGFYALLEATLKRHDAVPSHSVAELLCLRDLLGDEQALLLLREAGGALVAGAYLVRTTPRVWEVYYLASDLASAVSASSFLYFVCMEFAASQGASWVNMGLCMENRELNPSLLAFKEGLGAEPVIRHVTHPII